MAFDPHLYRLLHTGVPGDVDFYRTRCAGVDSVLELGCGEGRVLLPIAADGAQVVGLEQHPGMLAAAREAAAKLPAAVAARIELVAGDMGDFGFDRRFDRVILPYTTLYCLDPGTRQICLERIERHLAPDGRLIFDGWVGDDLRERGPFAEDTPEWIDGLRDGDRIVEIFERDVHRPGRIDVTYIHQIARPGEMPVRSAYTITHHYLCTDEVDDVLAAAGLQVLEIFGDFDGGPLDDDAERMVIVAGRAER